MQLPFPYEETADVWCLDGVQDASSMIPLSSRARRLLQEVLSRYLGIEAAMVSIAKDALGKPFLQSPSVPYLGFSVSYSADCVLIAVGSGAVGADVEREHPCIRLNEIARRWLHPGEAKRVLESSPGDRARHFFQAWTLRESYLKVLGTGFRDHAGTPEIVRCEGPSGGDGAISMGHVVLGTTRHVAVAMSAPLRILRLIDVGAGGTHRQIPCPPLPLGMGSVAICVTPTAWRVR